MTIQIFLLLSLLFVNALTTVERKVIVPTNAAPPVGPYSPGILIGDYLYVSGQGVRDAKSQMPLGVEAQARQCLVNVKAIVTAAGLTMEHVVHMQLYLEKMSDLPEVEKVYATYFPTNPPARVVIGTAKMPTDTTIEMTVVAVRDLAAKKVLALKSLKPLGHASAAVQAGQRVYLSAIYGKDIQEVSQRLKLIARESPMQVLWRNDYGTTAGAALPMNELPEQAGAAISVVALQGTPQRKGGCAADGKTIYCQAQSDASAASVQEQVKGVMSKLKAALALHGADFSHVTASNVYLDDISEFRLMNETYATYFAAAPPTRTTVQPFAKADRSNGKTALVKISVVAVKD
jgi:2-iminobutanoate/2-iminopropanoate deaminase